MSKNKISKEIFKAAAIIVIPTACLFEITSEAARYLTNGLKPSLEHTNSSNVKAPIEKELVAPINKRPIKQAFEIHP